MERNNLRNKQKQNFQKHVETILEINGNNIENSLANKWKQFWKQMKTKHFCKPIEKILETNNRCKKFLKQIKIWKQTETRIL